MRLVRAYWQICSMQRGLSLFGVFLAGASGLLEGAALLTLIPVLSGDAQGGGAAANLPTILKHWFPTGNAALGFGLAAFVALGFLASGARFGAETTFLKVRTGIDEHAKREMTRALLEVSWSRFLAMRIGDISKAIIMEGIQMATGAQIILQALGAALAAMAYLGVALLISVEMTFYTIGFTVLTGTVYLLASRRMARHADALSSLVSHIGQRVADLFGHLKFFRSTGASAEAEKRSHSIYREYADTYFRSQVYAPLMRFVLEGAGLLFISLFLAVTVLLKGGSATTALIFLAVFYRLSPRLLTVQDGIFRGRSYLCWYETWAERMAYARKYREPEVSEGRDPVFLETLQFLDVDFRYPESTERVFHRLNLLLGKGEFLAVVGPSGAGKTTLLDLLTMLLKPVAGDILLDGVSFREIDALRWRERIGLVQQESPLFHASILENIAWGDPAPDPERAMEAARLAHAGEFISRLPEGLHSIIGEQGGRLSGGQRQRLALARALYRRPSLLLLDEPTSALDGEAEEAVLAALEGIRGSCTIFMISHRLRTVQTADRILVLEGGRVVEDGNWDSLVVKPGGSLNRMARAQGLLNES